MLRRRLETLLNVLCTLNLRPVSGGSIIFATKKLTYNLSKTLVDPLAIIKNIFK